MLGADPLGLGYDQALSLFLNKQAGLMIDNSMGLAKIKASGVDLTELKSFYLPYSKEDGSINRVILGDFYMGVTNTSENQELAKAFLEFYFNDFYPDYVQKLSCESTMSTAPKEKDHFMAYADEEGETINLVNYVGGGDDYRHRQRVQVRLQQGGHLDADRRL